jgi:adenylosuccinate synthase
MQILEKCQVEYATFVGWQQSISNCRNFEYLPEKAKIYVNFIQDTLQVPGKFFSTFN